MSRVINIPGTDSSLYYFDVAANRIPDSNIITKFSTNGSIGTSWEDIWSAGGTKTMLTAASTLHVVSTDANDTLIGTGARKLLISGLDANWKQISEVVDLNGITASASTTKSFIRVTSVTITETGTYGGTNIGSISIIEDNTSTLQSYIAIESGEGAGQARDCHYTIPAGHVGYIIGMHLSVATNKNVNYSVQIRKEADNTINPTPWQTMFHIDGVEGSHRVSPPAPLEIPEKTDIRIRAIVSTGSAEGSFDYQLVLLHRGDNH